MTHRGDWMQSYGGKRFYPHDLRKYEFQIEDVAHALSQTCRYGGMCDRFYSVAEHSYWMSLLVGEFYPLLRDGEYEGLMHDGHEPYVGGDIPTPTKRGLPEFRAFEDRGQKVFARRFHVDYPTRPEVSKLDRAICLSERDCNMKSPPGSWGIPECGWRIKIKCWSPKKAEKMFLLRYRELTDEKLSWVERLTLRMNQLEFIDHYQQEAPKGDAICTSSESTGRLDPARTPYPSTSAITMAISVTPSRIR